MKRSCGVLLPVASLPSKYGIGTFGRAAYDFIDFLHSAGQSFWQVLPLGPTSYGDSPYQSFSVHAGSPYYIDLDLLIADGLLTAREADAVDFGDDAGRVDYERLYLGRFDLLERAAERGWERDRAQVRRFEAENAAWLPDYALFMALKRHFGMRAWSEWDDGARLRGAAALERYRTELAGDIRLFTYIQFLFFRQWDALRAYAREKGIGIIGDMPIYAALDSADVWAEPEQFLLDAERRPTEVAGVPPDYFSETGQLWGNPLYSWERMKLDGYAWWLRRMRSAARMYDVLRIDHFRGLESYWAVPAGAEDARSGQWCPGPGLGFIELLKRSSPGLELIAEDLGDLTDGVRKMLKESGLPGMRVLEFAFDPGEESSYLPHNLEKNCVCYTGTHDNAPLGQWLAEAPAENIAFAKKYLGLNDEEGYIRGVIRGGMSSAATLFVAQMQDWLGLGAGARTNTPGTLGGNWSWRLTEGELTPRLASEMAEASRIYGRAPGRTAD